VEWLPKYAPELNDIEVADLDRERMLIRWPNRESLLSLNAASMSLAIRADCGLSR
jgi:transposase